MNTKITFKRESTVEFAKKDLWQVLPLLKKRRAISEVIVTLLMVAITVVGAVMISTLFTSSQITDIGQSIGSSADSSFSGIKLIGYDTRDGSDISGISTIDNTTDDPPSLCADDTCGGTEHIVLKIRSLSSGVATIENVQINNVAHMFDTSTNGMNVLNPGQGPDDGMFSIIPIDNGPPIIQQSSSEITNTEVRLVIKLSEDIDSEIEIGQVMKVVISITNGEPAIFLIPAGATV